MNWLLASASGLLLVLLFPDAEIKILAPLAMTPLLIAITRERLWYRRFALGEACGFIFWAGTCYWIRPVLAAYGGLNTPLAWLTLILFALAKALHTAVFAALAGCVVYRSWAIPAIAALWVGIERTHGVFGFAWLTLGNAGATMDFPARIAPYLGVYGISFLFALLSAAIAALILRRPRLQLAWVLAVPAIMLLPKLPDERRAARMAVALQPNLTEDDKASPLALVVRSEAATSSEAELIVWPEVPAGFYWDRDPDFRAAMDRMARSTDKPVLFGAVTHDRSGHPLNSAVLIDRDGKERGRYSKVNLVPFGEFIPPLFGWISKISTEAGDFAAGDAPQVLGLGALKLGTFICYESAFPEYVRQYVTGGANVLVNLSNDAWFFHTAARRQHLLLARMRAIENQRWILRVTNNGITAAIDPAGRVLDSLPEFEAQARRLQFDAITEATFYSQHGDWFAWSCLALGIAAVIRAELPAHRRP